VLTTAVGWAARTVRRVGARRLLRHGIRPVTFVMHQFMDAEQVEPAWDLMQRGETAVDPAVRATQERLQACHYAMGHPAGPDGGEFLVPACVQHGVLDPAENAALRVLLPMPTVRARKATAP
jgi:hypothetical protein